MIAKIKPCRLSGRIDAPPSKSMAHRFLIGAALSGQNCTITGVAFSEDILATIDCLRALGARVEVMDDTVKIDPQNFMKTEDVLLSCWESGSTLRFFIPLALCLGKKVTLVGSERLFARPLEVYEDLCRERGFLFEKNINSVVICGKITSGNYKVRGDISSQFITGLIFALAYLGEPSTIEIIPPFESKSYINLTISALKAFGFDVSFFEEYKIKIRPSETKSFIGKVEGDYSNAAFLDAFNSIGSALVIDNLNPDSLQGDKIYSEYFDMISSGAPDIDISDCPDLGPVLFALAAMKNGATFLGTDRLKAKESDRGAAMDAELFKLGGGLIFGDNAITVPKQRLKYNGIMLDGHNDHRIVMALAVILSKIGGSIKGAEAVKKSYPNFFDDIKKLGAEVSFIEE